MESYQIFSGSPLRFPADLPTESRTILSSWVKGAINQGLRVEIENAIIDNCLDLQYEVVNEEVLIRNSQFVNKVELSYARFLRVLDLRATTFNDVAILRAVVFESDVRFQNTSFGQKLDLHDAIVKGLFICTSSHLVNPNFQRAIFHRSVWFRQTIFVGDADFNSVRIKGNANFSYARFSGTAFFNGACLEKNANFNPTYFDKSANFVDIQIGQTGYFDWEKPGSVGSVFDDCDFSGARVKGSIYFDGAVFNGIAGFGHIDVGIQASFIGVCFNENASFEGAIIRGNALFHGTRFKRNVFFIRTRFHSEISFQDALIGDGSGNNYYYEGTVFESLVSFRGALIDLDLIFDGEKPTMYVANTECIGARTPVTFGGDVDLRGAKYDSIAIVSWEKIMNRQKPFDRQPYIQLEKNFRDRGNRRLANAIYYKRKHLEGKQKTGLHRMADIVLKVLVGYGVVPVRLLAWIIGLILVSTIVLQQKLRWSDAFWVSLNALLPVNLPLGQVWETAIGQSIHITFGKISLVMSISTIASILTIIGWIVIPVGLASLTGVIKGPQRD